MARGGRREGAGRKPGQVNKFTPAIKTMIVEALEKAGGVKYLLKQAKANPTSFMTLIGRLIPHEVTGAGGAPLIPDRPADSEQVMREAARRWLAVLEASRHGAKSTKRSSPPAAPRLQ